MNIALNIALLLVSLAILLCLYRVIAGPSRSDRVAALDTVGINIIAVIAILSVMYRTTNYLEIILVIGILTFIGTTALARFIERGTVLEEGGE